MRCIPGHVEFRQLQDAKPYLEGFIDPQASLLALDCAEVLAVDPGVHELRLRHQLPELLFVGNQRDGGALLLILHRFAKNTVVHQLEHILLERCFGLLTHLLVNGDVGSHTSALVVLDTSVDLAQNQSMLNIKLELADVHYILLLIH